jgi:choline dehydrogenase-like flavoprotein
MNREIQPWRGTMQGVYSEVHARLAEGFGVRYETGAIHPTMLAALSPWHSGAHHHALMRDLPKMVGIGVLLRDKFGGRVDVDKRGNPVARYALSRFDQAHVRAGVLGAARILAAAGARTIRTSQKREVAWDGRTATLDAFLRAADTCGWSAGPTSFISFHLMGTAAMGDAPRSSVCSPRGETWEVRNLYVCDGSAFPNACGVNPMVSIEAVAHMNARALADRMLPHG